MAKNRANKGIFSLFSSAAPGDAIEGRLLEYDWRIEGRPAEYGVDLHFSSRAGEGELPLLAELTFCEPQGSGKREKREKGVKSENGEGDEKAERRENGESGEAGEGGGLSSPAVLKWALALLKKSKKALERLEIAGYIEAADSLKYYIYLPSDAELLRLKALAADMKNAGGVALELTSRTEPEHESYYELLYPDEAKLLTVRNGEIIAELYKNGDSDTPRRLNLLLAFPTEADCAAFASAALDEGFATGEYKDVADGELPCGVVVHRICAMKKWDVDALTVHAQRLAEEYGGRLLYWDCPIVPRRA